MSEGRAALHEPASCATVERHAQVPKIKQPPPQSGPPEFYYEQTPEQVCAWQVHLQIVLTSLCCCAFRQGSLCPIRQVDWLGQKAQIDAAKQAGIQKVRSKFSSVAYVTSNSACIQDSIKPT
jgi:hypothetical protein